MWSHINFKIVEIHLLYCALNQHGILCHDNVRICFHVKYVTVYVTSECYNGQVDG